MDQSIPASSSPFEIDNTAGIPELVKAVQQLQSAMAQHNHDGFNSQAFQSILLTALSARAIGIRKASFTDAASGFWVGLDGDTVKFALGDGTVANSITWDGSRLLIKGQNSLTQGIFGDGSDGNVTISVNTTLTRDMFYKSLVVNAGNNLITNGYRIYAQVSVTTSGTIHNNGGTGGTGGTGSNATSSSAGGGGTAGSGGTGGAAGSLPGGATGAAGGIGGAGYTGTGTSPGGPGGASPTGNPGTTLTLSMGGSAVAGNTIGVDSSTPGSGGIVSLEDSQNGGLRGAGGSAGVQTTTIDPTQHNPILASTYFDQFTNRTCSVSNGGNTGGGGGAGEGTHGTANHGGNGGGGGGAGGNGGNGGCVAIYSPVITINLGGAIASTGGFGGAGGGGGAASRGTSNTEAAGGGGGGNGGSAGNGGVIILVYQTFTNNGSLAVNAGTVGTGGAAGTLIGSGSSNGNAGASGLAGVAGKIYQMQLAS